MRGALLSVAAGLAFAVVVFVATSGHIVFLPLILVPLVLIWPGGKKRP